MDIATSESSYISALEAYNVSVNTINFWRKRITLILILGTVTIALVVLVKAIFFPPTYNHQYSEGEDFFKLTHKNVETFEITCLAAISAIICGLLGRKIRPVDDLQASPETLSSEQDYELALQDRSEEIGENDELINQQKRFAAFSFGLFLVSDLMLILL